MDMDSYLSWEGTTDIEGEIINWGGEKEIWR
jgi:hypothetical protein